MTTSEPSSPSTVKTKYHSFSEYAAAEYTAGLKGKIATQLMQMYHRAAEKAEPVILELGTATGQSTTVFLQACAENRGKLVSVDVDDCSDVAESPNWTFIRSDSTAVAHIIEQAPVLKNGIDILYVDSLHTREHVEKEIIGWYPHLNANSWIFFDDVDSNPYRKGNRKDSYFAEWNWDQIHECVQGFFYANEDDLLLSVSYGSTGLAVLHKLTEKGSSAKPVSKIMHRRWSFFSSLRHGGVRSALSYIKRRLSGKSKR